MCHVGLLQRFLFKIIEWKNWVQKLLEVVETPNKIQPKSNTQISSTERHVSEQPPGLLTKGIEKRCLVWLRKHQLKNAETCEKSCVTMSVEGVDKDKDADQTSTRRLVSGKPTRLFTQLEEIDMDIRVSGLPHAVVKQAENFHVRELVKKIESHPHREAFQADLQQNNVFYPFSDDSKAMIREMDNVELFELCETIPKVQCSECFLDWKQGVIYCTCGHLMVESESSQHFHQWRLDALSIRHYVILNPALHHQNGATSWCSARQETENWC